MSLPLIGYSYRMVLRTAESIKEMDRVVDNLTALCEVPRRDREREDYRAVADRVRPISAQAAEHIDFAHERSLELEGL